MKLPIPTAPPEAPKLTQVDELQAKPKIDMDALMNVTEAASWIGMSERALLDNVRRKKIPAIFINARVIRFHPRTILAKKGCA